MASPGMSERPGRQPDSAFQAPRTPPNSCLNLGPNLLSPRSFPEDLPYAALPVCSTHRWEALAGSHSTRADSSRSLPAGIFPTEVSRTESVGGQARREEAIPSSTQPTPVSPISPVSLWPSQALRLLCLLSSREGGCRPSEPLSVYSLRKRVSNNFRPQVTPLSLKTPPLAHSPVGTGFLGPGSEVLLISAILLNKVETHDFLRQKPPFSLLPQKESSGSRGTSPSGRCHGW